MNFIKNTTSPLFLLSTTTSYLSSLFILKKIMNNKSSYSLKIPMIIYNSFQIFINIYMIYGLSSLPQLSINNFNLFGVNTLYNSNLEYFTYIHYLSKYLDYFDTWFIILRKKERQLSFLHIYHHSTIGIIWGFLLYNSNGNGTASFGCLINSFIHLLMYLHYLLTSLGINNPFKKIITKAQLSQFYLCLIHSILVLLYENIYPINYAWLQLIYQIQMICLFSNFYSKNYNQYKYVNYLSNR